MTISSRLDAAGRAKLRACAGAFEGIPLAQLLVVNGHLTTDPQNLAAAWRRINSALDAKRTPGM